MKKMTEHTTKELKRASIKVGLLILVLPFGISASFNFLPLWLSLPIGFILGLSLLILIATLVFIRVELLYTKEKNE